MKWILSFLLILSGFSTMAQSDSLFLHNGDTIIGSIYAQNKYITKIYVDTAWLFIQNTEIRENYKPTYFDQAEDEIRIPDGPEFYTIPAGEFLVIKTNRALNSRYTKTGEIIECRLTQAIVNREGLAILPQNTPIIGRVKYARNGTAFKSAQLQLELIEIHINGEIIPITTTNDIRILENYTAERILGSAASGSIFGGIFYDEWLRGALLGATIGTVSSLIVENRNIIIPENSSLEFMTDKRINIRIN